MTVNVWPLAAVEDFGSLLLQKKSQTLIDALPSLSILTSIAASGCGMGYFLIILKV